MALPETIPVRYSEEEAGYVSFRAVVRQTFRLHELLDMVLSVTGKDPARIRQILRSGTVVFHFYRYWWDGFEPAEDELNSLLAGFPDADPARLFSPVTCTLALIESGESPAGSPVEVPRAAMSHKRLFRSRSFWDALMAAAQYGPLTYGGYSYARRADLYHLPLTPEVRVKLAAAAPLAPRNMAAVLQKLDGSPGIVFVSGRN